MEETRRRETVIKWVVVGIAIGVIVTSTIFVALWGLRMIFEEQNNDPDIRLGDNILYYPYFVDSDRRENTTVTLYNWGHVDGYARVIFYIECNGRIQDGEIKKVFVPSLSSVKVVAELNVPELPTAYHSRQEILDQWKR